MCLRRRKRHPILEAFRHGNVVPHQHFQGLQVVRHSKRVELVEARYYVVIFDVGKPANVQDEFGSPSPRRQLVADAFDVPVRQTQSFTNLPQAQTRKHLLLRGPDIVGIEQGSITTLLRNRNSRHSVSQFV